MTSHEQLLILKQIVTKSENYMPLLKFCSNDLPYYEWLTYEGIFYLRIISGKIRLTKAYFGNPDVEIYEFDITDTSQLDIVSSIIRKLN